MKQKYRTRLAPEYGVLQLTGSGVSAFLQGYLTCDCDSLNNTELTPAAICNLRGRVVATLFACRTDDGVELILSRDLIEPVAAYFSKYLVFSKIELGDASTSRPVIAYLGELPGGVKAISPTQGLWAVDETPVLKQEVSSDEWSLASVEQGLPLVTAATSELFLPQMLGLDRLGWLSFDKGCYLGQEVVARAQHLGEVKRELMTLNWSGPAPSPGDKLKPNGVVVQSANTGNTTGKALAVLSVKRQQSYENENGTQFTPG